MSEEQLFIGVENEFIPRYKSSGIVKTYTKKDFENLRNNIFPSKKNFGDYNHYNISETSIRGSDGNGYYIDVYEPEIVTPPIVINKGFSTRLTDSLMIGRDNLLNSRPGLDFVGYSMHWNLSCNNNIPVDKSKFYEVVSIPFQLFGLNPLSSAFNLRSKDGGKRIELLGDSIVDENQIKAAALLLGSTSLAISNSKEYSDLFSVFREDNYFYSDKKTENFILEGRDSLVDIVYKNRRQIVTVQEFMEDYFTWIKPYAKILSNDEEFSLLEKYISNDLDLEYDKFKLFADLKSNGGIIGDKFASNTMENGEMSERVLKVSGKKRELPLENKIFGNIVKNKDWLTSYLDWSSVTIIPKFNFDDKLKFNMDNYYYTVDSDCNGHNVVKDELYCKKLVYNTTSNLYLNFGEFFLKEDFDESLVLNPKVKKNLKRFHLKLRKRKKGFKFRNKYDYKKDKTGFEPKNLEEVLTGFKNRIFSRDFLKKVILTAGIVYAVDYIGEFVGEEYLYDKKISYYEKMISETKSIEGDKK